MDTVRERLWAAAPTAALVVAVLVGGLVASQLMARLVAWLVRRLGLETAAEKLGLTTVLYAAGLRAGVAHLAGRVTLFGGALITLLVAADVAGIQGVAAGLGGLVAYLPRLIIAALVFTLGVVNGGVIGGRAGKRAS